MYAFGVTLEETFPEVIANPPLTLNSNEEKLKTLIDNLKSVEPAKRPTAKETVAALKDISVNLNLYGQNFG